jgi:hypothetical protein
MPSLPCPGVARTGLGCCIRAGPSWPLCMRAALRAWHWQSPVAGKVQHSLQLQPPATAALGHGGRVNGDRNKKGAIPSEGVRMGSA